MSRINSIFDWLVDHMNAVAWTAVGGFSFWGLIEGRIQSALNGSRVGCASLMFFAGVVGLNVGRWLVHHFELAEANDKLATTSQELSVANARNAELEELIKGKEAAIENEKRKNAKLAARWNVKDEHSCRAAEKRMRNEAIERLPHLPYSMRAILQEAFDGGGYLASRDDANATALVNLGYLETPPEGASGEVTFLIQPWFWEYVDKNWEKLFPGSTRLIVEEN